MTDPEEVAQVVHGIADSLDSILRSESTIYDGHTPVGRIPFLKHLGLVKLDVVIGATLDESLIRLELEGADEHVSIAISGPMLKNVWEHPILPDRHRPRVEQTAIDLSRAISEFLGSTNRQPKRVVTL